MSGEGFNHRSANFEQLYRCYPPSLVEKQHLENGDKVLLPQSAIEQLAKLQIEYPMLFELSNLSTGRVSHCGVLEFIADEGLMYLPSWMMKNMLLQEGDLVQVKNISLSKGKYVKLQPHTTDFLDISNPKAVLEKTLRSYSCLTTGDTIMVAYNNKRFYINIVETKPSAAVSIIETDCEVDFAPPLDYKEPPKPAPTAPLKRKIAPEEGEPAEKVAKFSAFTGSARRLDGKLTQSEATDSPRLKQHQAKLSNVSNDSKSSALHQHRRKLVFGSNTQQATDKTPQVVPKDSSLKTSEKTEKQTFQAFTGKKYSLRG